ncbi:MAG: DUF1983 domain-containing protein, partial [Emcibacteraceae bacterium]|nr:DUF1983 domain-containing protein [Emcibacteraceae bacterium]
RRKAIPNVPSSVSRELRPLLDALRENAQILGRQGRGDPLDSAVTMRDLNGVGGFSFSKQQGGLSSSVDTSDGVISYPTPPKPQNVKYLPTFENLIISWAKPNDADYWYQHTEIWAAQVSPDTPNPLFSHAVRVGVAPNMFTSLNVPTGATYRYWIRFVNLADTVGPLDDANGTDVTPYRTPSEVMEEYSKEFYDGENYAYLKSEIGSISLANRISQAAGEDSGLVGLISQIDSLSDLLAEQQMMEALDKHTVTYEIKAQFSKNFARLSGGVHAAVDGLEAYVNRIAVLESNWVNDLDAEISSKITEYDVTLTSPTGAIADSIEKHKVSYDGVDVTMEQLASTVANNDGKYEAQWGVKQTVGEVTGGVGLFNDGSKVSFAVDANSFVFTDNGETPFIIKEGNVVINTAYIETAIITDLVAESIVTDDLFATKTITGPIINAGEFNSGKINVGNGKFTVSTAGKVVAKDITILDASGEEVLTTAGINASWVDGLTEYVKDNITTPTYIATAITDQLISARIYAKNIEGDVMDAAVEVPSEVSVDINNESAKTAHSFKVTAETFIRTVTVA